MSLALKKPGGVVVKSQESRPVGFYNLLQDRETTVYTGDRVKCSIP